MKQSLENHKNIFHALSDTTRLQLLQLIAERNNPVFSDLVEILGKPAPLISNHLKVLEHLGLITQNKVGRNMEYRVLSRWISEIKNQIVHFEQVVNRIPTPDFKEIREEAKDSSVRKSFYLLKYIVDDELSRSDKEAKIDEKVLNNILSGYVKRAKQVTTPSRRIEFITELRDLVKRKLEEAHKPQKDFEAELSVNNNDKYLRRALKLLKNNLRSAETEDFLSSKESDYDVLSSLSRFERKLKSNFINRDLAKEKLKEIYETLSERDKIMFTLRYIEGVSYSDIAKILNLSESRISQIHSETLEKIKRMLQKSNETQLDQNIYMSSSNKNREGYVRI